MTPGGHAAPAAGASGHTAAHPVQGSPRDGAPAASESSATATGGAAGAHVAGSHAGGQSGGQSAGTEGDPSATPRSDPGNGAQSVPAAAVATLSTAPKALPTSLPTAGYAVRLAQAAEAVQTTIAMAARQGASQARIELAPATLGGISIHLSHTDDGLVARVVTEHPEAAQTLSQNSADLRRSLEQGGTTLLRLDISSSGQHDGGSAADGSAGRDSSSTRAGLSEDGDPDLDTTTTTDISTLGLSATTLVDVLA